MSSTTEVRIIPAKDTLPLRQKVLRPYLRPDECSYPEDQLLTTFHLGIVYNQKIVSVSTFMTESSPHFGAGFPYRLRGMATDEAYRGQGFGSEMLRYGLHILKEKRCDFLWCNARFLAFAFYQSVGFQFHGDLFDIKGIGPHKVMYKVIIPR